jgi:cytochrome b subunit of formate dehydrogenase
MIQIPRAVESLLFCACVLACGGPLPAQTHGGSGCSSCHDQGQKLQKSAHAALSCDFCHEQHETYPHPSNASKPACASCHDAEAADYERSVHGRAARSGGGAPDCAVCHIGAHELLRPKSSEFRAAVPATCGMCHAEVAEQFQSSVHGQALQRGVAQAPICADCHGEHSIERHSSESSPVSTGHISQTCGACHGNVRLSARFGMPTDRLVTYDASFHGLAAKSGNQTVANCASCHGVHNILRSTDPKSTINPKNLAQTCGKCHAGAGQRFAISPVHIVENQTEPAAVRWVRAFYSLVIPLVIGLMLLHNAGDWARKVYRLRFQQASAGKGFAAAQYSPEVRMLPFERVQHAALALSFLVLVWTGFALKYPDQWWARPLLGWENRWPIRSLIHRSAAAVFILVSVTHAVSLALSARLWGHWKALWPRAGDIAEAAAGTAYNLGFRSSPAVRSAHSYVEKAEYWAVVWGAVVMILTGVMLWANNLMLALLPKSWLDVATSVHFYEAVLAALAIVVWHFYAVIFNPDVYPMDMAWFNGHSVRKQRQSENNETIDHQS